MTWPLSPDEAARLARTEEETQPRGPYLPAVALGILGLLVAAAVLLRELHVAGGDLTLWAPWAVVGLGVALLLTGAFGIARRAR